MLKILEKEYSNNPDKIFDLKDYPSLTYADLVNHFGKGEINLIKSKGFEKSSSTHSKPVNVNDEIKDEILKDYLSSYNYKKAAL